MPLFHANLPPLVQVRLVAREDEQHVVVPQRPCILNPLVHARERLARRHVVADDSYRTILDVGGNQTFEALLPGRVPQVQDDDLVLDVHLLRHEIDTDGRLVRVIERIVDESVDDTGLADRLVAEEHNLVLILPCSCFVQASLRLHFIQIIINYI